MKQQCKKCKRMRSLKYFSKFKVYTLNGIEVRRRSICYDCSYGSAKYHRFSDFSDNEKLEGLEKRFNKFVIKKEGCWGWNGFIRPDGYTRIHFGSRHNFVGGHIASWMIHNKKIKKDKLYVLHKCDNRSCTNPEHLFLGTHQDNMIDMVKKGRHSPAKLTMEQVIKIKELISIGVTLSKIAKKYKVHWATIADIKNNRTWKYVK